MLLDEPPSLRDRFEGGDVADAYLAAVAVSLARELGVVRPRWVWGPSRRLRRPWFAHAGPALRATLLAAKPGAIPRAQPCATNPRSKDLPWV